MDRAKIDRVFTMCDDFTAEETETLVLELLGSMSIDSTERIKAEFFEKDE